MSLPKEQHSQESEKIRLHLDGHLETSGPCRRPKGQEFIESLRQKDRYVQRLLYLSFAMRMLRKGSSFFILGQCA